MDNAHHDTKNSRETKKNSILDDAALDIILDEELEKLDLAADEVSSADVREFFPASKDCNCCKGYMTNCDCTSVSSAEHCTKCCGKEDSVGTQGSVSPEYAATTGEGQFTRAVQASAEAVSSQAAPGLSRNPSVTSNENVFNFSVKIFPPPSSVLQRDMFKMMFVPAIVASLGSGPNGEPLTWPDRGWRSQAEFDVEMGAALQKRTCHIDGIVVARNQTEHEASKLAEAMSALEVRACVADCGTPPLVSTSMPPPTRTPPPTCITVPSHTTLSGLDPSYNPQSRRHHVVLYLPDEAERGSLGMSAFVDTWYDAVALGHFTRILGSEDPDRGNQTRFTWPERGWQNAQQFEAHTKASLKDHGYCVFARKQNYRDAVVVHERLRLSKFVSSVIMTLSLADGSDPAPVTRCPNSHEMSRAVTGMDMLTSRRCDACNDLMSAGETHFRCQQCDYDLCTTCINETTGTPCKILFGKDAGQSMMYPPSAAGNAVAPTTVDLMAMLQQAMTGARENGGSGASDDAVQHGLMNALSSLLRGGAGHNAKPGTKKSFLDKMVHKTVTADESDECKAHSCVICMSDFEEGEVVTSLPCGHWFHSGKMKRSNEDKSVTNSDGVLSKPSFDSFHKKESRHYCGRYVGQSGYDKACGSCDGVCGPTNGCQCKACSALDEGNDDFGECQGILPWLKKNNECPMCRTELEAESPHSSDGNNTWSCPGCRRDIMSFACDMCGIRRNIVVAYNVTAAPLFDMVDSLFFALLSYHNRVARGDGSASPAEKEALSTSITAVLVSREMQAVTGANWAIRDAVAHLLHSAFHGERNFSFESSWMDTGSQAMYAMLVDRLTSKLQQMESEGGEVWSIERPVIASVAAPQQWECSLCEKIHDSTVQTCECGVDQRVMNLATEDDTETMFMEAEILTFRSLDLATGRVNIDGRANALASVRKDTARFLNSSLVKSLETRGWKVRIQFSSFLNSLQNGKTNIPFESEFVDTNSIGLYACFIRRMVSKIAVKSAECPEYSSVTIGLPVKPEQSQDDMNFEDLSAQQYFVHPNTEGFLRTNKRTLLLIARLIAEGSGPQSWEAITGVVLPQFNRGGWIVANAVSLMRRGMRDLHTLAGGLDPGSQAVIEVILRKVIALEQAAAEKSGEVNEDDMPPVPLMTRQVSVGTEARNVLADLRSRMSEDEYKKVVLFLLKTLKHIISDQSNLYYRRLKKDAPLIAELVLPHDEVMSVLTALGFVDDGNVLFLKSVNRDHLLRAQTVITDLVRAAGIDVL